MQHPNYRGRTRASRWLCVVMLFAATTATVHAGPGGAIVLPPLTQPASGEHHAGKVIWADLITPDLAGAEHFYGGLFGWTFRNAPGTQDYALALLDGQAVGGLYHKPLPTGPLNQPIWLTFLAVSDVDAAQKAAVAHGGKVLTQAHTYAHRGRQATLSDPDGAVFAILAAEGGDPPDYLAAPGQWIWASALVADPKQETDFYKGLFGYDIYDLANEGGTADDAQHYILSSDNYARAGLNAQPTDSRRRHPHWLNFIRVADASDAAKKAVELGGRVLVEPRIDRHGGHLAVLADPSGAPFGVMEWSDTDDKEEPK